VADLVLRERDQRAMRSLLAAEPVPGSPIPSRDFLENLATLIPCDTLGVAVALNSGPVTHFVEIPSGYADNFVDATPEHGGPFYIGVMHWTRAPLQAEACQAILPGHADGLAVGFRNGPDAVAQVFLDRRKHMFGERDLAMLDLLMPALQRHLRQRPTPTHAASLTVQERRVLMLVAAGESNAEIAAHLFISPSTVRKHLENAYRKLGVSNRMAAVVAFEGRALPEPDRRERVERYA
jgi:DNA-binding CsgD family transcriptional regulator